MNRTTSSILICFIGSWLALLLSGCVGDDGKQGRQGILGPPGSDGIDSERVSLPSPHYLTIGIVNGPLHAVAGSNVFCVTFDTTALTAGDTVVASRLATPPLLDGNDGGSEEWGSRKTVLSLHALPLAPGDSERPESYVRKATCCIGFDDGYFYVMLKWMETAIWVDSDGGPSRILVGTGESRDVNPMYVDIAHPQVREYFVDGQRRRDTLFSNVRIHQSIRLDSICYPPPPSPPMICDYLYDTIYDTTLVWKTFNTGEDKVCLLWGTERQPAFGRLPEMMFSTDPINLSGLGATSQMDLWRWGAGTSGITDVSDDWSLSNGILTPDWGNVPFSFNWVATDSTPRYMHQLDPNYATSLTSWFLNTPIWFFEAKPYEPRGWSRDAMAFVSGVVVSVPSGSRADVYASDRFDDGEWVVEFKRARKTGNPDDLQF